MARIYFDNAATTSLDREVLDAMMPFLTNRFGNPSSIYSYGREGRLAVESARKSVARLLNANPAEIFFTSGGTESSNTAITASVRDLGCTHILTSALEHHATLHTIEYLVRRGEASSSQVKLHANGHVDLEDLGRQLQASGEKCLVSLMHANNEIGNLLDLAKAGEICRAHGAVFYSDTVQTVGHFPFDLRRTAVDFIAGSAHKFHGPKGSGILFVREGLRISAYIHGGSQERNMRAGTENVYGIVGFAKALELASPLMDADSRYIRSLKQYMLESLTRKIPGVSFNGDPLGSSLYTVLSANFPKTLKSEMILMNLDIHNICASGGSACTSGVEQRSHVIAAINDNPQLVTVRFSFCKHNTREEIDWTVDKIHELI
jgi:cysteine desulfurase